MTRVALSIPMESWDYIFQFHEFVHKDHANGVEGLAAVRFLRGVFEPSWKGEGSRRHPMFQRVAQASEDSYRSLIEHARKIRAVQAIPGFSTLLARLGNPDEYAAASAEMEVALMLRFGGFDVAFVETGLGPSPDLMVSGEGKTFAVEVGSLNPPEEDARLNDVAGRVIFAGLRRAATGGVISRPPSNGESKAIDIEVSAAVQRAIEGHRVERVNFPGLATIYVAPRDLAGQMPEDMRDQFCTVPLYRGPPEEKIARAVRGKLRQLGAGVVPSVLFLFDRSLGAETLSKLFDDPADDVSVVLSSVPVLMGLAVIAPIHSLLDPKRASRKSRGRKTLLRIQTGVREWTDVLLWENQHSDEKLPAAVLGSLEEYNSNLSHLPDFRLQESAGSKPASGPPSGETDGESDVAK